MQQSHAAAWPRYTAVHYMQIALWPSLWSRLVHEVQDQNEMGQASSKLLTAMHIMKKSSTLGDHCVTHSLPNVHLVQPPRVLGFLCAGLPAKSMTGMAWMDWAAPGSARLWAGLIAGA